MKRIALFFSILAFYGCGNDGKKNNDDQAFINSLDSMTLEQPTVSEEVVGDIIQQVPTPLEISFLIKNSGAKYTNEILNNSDKVTSYNSNFKKAINLGIFGTDLGYANIYNENQDALDYLTSIKSLSNDLNIGQFFDFKTIKRLATNSQNLDSLLLITTKNFNKINSHLQDNRRANLSVLILTGGWLEALHVTNQVYASNLANEELKEKIGEQKIVLDNIVLLVDYYKNTDPNIADLSTDLKLLSDAYSGVDFEYDYQEPKFVERDGQLVIEDNSTTIVKVSQEQIQDITKIVEQIRNKLIDV
ncbi:hypothetical protein [Aureibacter tunicatorum]|uniref:Uncharacterized protein n=1 Tax=Aureibacter tunicatorum TaxID=866807 RepID=A0AAE4BQE9_9BACT|nr:hypothetical protein [Aureibacter tunicatorum]MDR6239034.1 hypothetical protein [Aureibacter tunicatorum]